MGFYTRPIRGRFLEGLSIDKHSILEYSRSRIQLYNFMSHKLDFTIFSKYIRNFLSFFKKIDEKYDSFDSKFIKDLLKN